MRLLESSLINNFFKENPEGYISLVMDDCVFNLKKHIHYTVDDTSISLWNTDFTDVGYGIIKIRRGDFIIPFNSIHRVEFITSEDVKM